MIRIFRIVLMTLLLKHAQYLDWLRPMDAYFQVSFYTPAMASLCVPLFSYSVGGATSRLMGSGHWEPICGTIPSAGKPPSRT